MRLQAWAYAAGHYVRVGPVAVFTRHRRLDAIRIGVWEWDRQSGFHRWLIF